MKPGEDKKDKSSIGASEQTLAFQVRKRQRNGMQHERADNKMDTSRSFHALLLSIGCNSVPSLFSVSFGTSVGRA